MTRAGDGPVVPLSVASAGNDAGAAAVLLVLADWDGTVYRLPRALLAPYRVASDAPMAAGRVERSRLPRPARGGRPA